MPYREYFRAANESLLIIDRRGTIVDANSKALEMLGYPVDELVGQSVDFVLPDDEAAARSRSFRKHLSAQRNGTPATHTTEFNAVARCSDGRELAAEVRLTNAPGTPCGDLVVVSIVDVTRRLALEEEVRRSENFAAMGTLAAGIAHDLANPLQVILSISELVINRPEATPKIREDIANIQRQVRRASRIVGQFLQLARKSEKPLALIDMNQLVGTALLLVRETMRHYGVEVITNLAGELPQIMGDATALERVLINLLSNSAEAMPQGGTVTISTGILPDTPEYIQITLQDDGPGISASEIARVFDLLYTSKPNGNGLGLWLSRRIIQEHHGNIEVESEAGKGAAFRIKLPAIV
jgi:two-component system sensor histidine kinase AtoS